VNGDDDAAVVAPMTTTTTSSSAAMVELEFYEQMDQAPTVMYMNYAIGMSPTLGYHKNRLCFEITSFPACAAAEEGATGNTGDDDNVAAEKEVAPGTSSSSSSTTTHTTTLATLFLSVTWALFSIMISS
jgi:hypothetical protein